MAFTFWDLIQSSAIRLSIACRTIAASACGEGGPHRCHLTKCLFTYSTIPLGQHIPQLLVFTHWPQWQRQAQSDNKECMFGSENIHAVTAAGSKTDVREVVIGQGAWQEKANRRGCWQFIYLKLVRKCDSWQLMPASDNVKSEQLQSSIYAPRRAYITCLRFYNVAKCFPPSVGLQLVAQSCAHAYDSSFHFSLPKTDCIRKLCIGAERIAITGDFLANTSHRFPKSRRRRERLMKGGRRSTHLKF